MEEEMFTLKTEIDAKIYHECKRVCVNAWEYVRELLIW